MDKKLIGVDLGGTTIKFAILTQDGEVQQKWSIKTNILDEGSHIVPDIIESINHHLGLYEMKPEQFIGIGMGTPGTVDVEKGTVIGAYNLNWKTLQNVKEEVEKALALLLPSTTMPTLQLWANNGKVPAKMRPMLLLLLWELALAAASSLTGSFFMVWELLVKWVTLTLNLADIFALAEIVDVLKHMRQRQALFALRAIWQKNSLESPHLKMPLTMVMTLRRRWFLIWLKKTMSWLSKSLIAFVATSGLHAQISAAFCIRNISSSVVVYLLPETSYWNKSPNISSNMLFQRFATRRRSNWHVLATMPA